MVVLVYVHMSPWNEIMINKGLETDLKFRISTFVINSTKEITSTSESDEFVYSNMRAGKYRTTSYHTFRNLF